MEQKDNAAGREILTFSSGIPAASGLSDAGKIDSLTEQRYKDENERYQKDTALKGAMAKWVKWLVSCYLIAVAGILVYSALTRGIADSVLIALLTTTTVNVLGLSYLVVRHLFPEGRKNR